MHMHTKYAGCFAETADLESKFCHSQYMFSRATDYLHYLQIIIDSISIYCDVKSTRDTPNTYVFAYCTSANECRLMRLICRSKSHLQQALQRGDTRLLVALWECKQFQLWMREVIWVSNPLMPTSSATSPVTCNTAR